MHWLHDAVAEEAPGSIQQKDLILGLNYCDCETTHILQLGYSGDRFS